MNLGPIIAIATGSIILLAYALIERRLNQRACPSCGFRMSLGNPGRACPRCSRAEPVRLNATARRLWPRLVLIAIPLGIVVVDAAVIISERTAPDTEKAIRLVKESRSRKENFTVQQYLYATLYHRSNSDGGIKIEGWRAQQSAGHRGPLIVQFVFEEQGVSQVAEWEVNLFSAKISPRNDAARTLSWN